MGVIKDRFKEKADLLANEIKDILKEHGTKKIGEVQLSQVYQGMRGITGLVSETSLLDSQEGIRFRGYSIPELQQKLPKSKGGDEPLPEGLFYLMLIGELPTEEDVAHITSVWQRRSFQHNFSNAKKKSRSQSRIRFNKSAACRNSSDDPVRHCNYGFTNRKS